MKNFNLILGGALLALGASSVNAAQIGMLIAGENTSSLNSQEAAAAKWFEENITDGVFVTPSSLDKIDATKLSALWINVDRLGIAHGVNNLPSEFNNPSVVASVKKFVADGGNLYLSKHATLLMTELGRVPSDFVPGIFGSADGGQGTDVWCVNAYIGSWQFTAGDETQIYDRRNHPIYAGMEEYPANYMEGIAMYPHPSFPLLGTGDGSPMHREDHNCMWDLNAYAWSAPGKNTTEQMENQFNCTLVGTWGHVQDYCVAGIIDFNPTEDVKGRIIANGLAAYEWAPRTANNAYHNNITKLTKNTLDYLNKESLTVVDVLDLVNDAPAAYYTLQGVKVDNPESGLYIVVKDGKASKVVLK